MMHWVRRLTKRQAFRNRISGGPQIEILAKKGDPDKYILQNQFLTKGLQLIFCRAKTAILKIANNIKTDQEKFDLAASFQKTIEKFYIKKLKLHLMNSKKKMI